MFAFIAYLTIVTVILLCIMSPKFRELVAKVLLGSLVVALLIYGGFALQDAARAEDVEFYDIVAIVTNIEDSDYDDVDVVVTVDDSDNLWDYYELFDDVEFDSDKELNDMAVRFIVDNGILAETLRDYPLTEGRIVVMRMWSCGTPDVEDDEILGVYYTEFIAV
jgi:hypothetical protein